MDTFIVTREQYVSMIHSSRKWLDGKSISSVSEMRRWWWMVGSKYCNMCFAFGVFEYSIFYSCGNCPLSDINYDCCREFARVENAARAGNPLAFIVAATDLYCRICALIENAEVME